ncbi:MAG: hypothetical protein AAF492_14885, partial [Verrucomicrobiota bacterium]
IRDEDRGAVESMLVDLHELSLGVVGRPTNLFMGLVSLGPEESRGATHCSFETTPESRTCDRSGHGVLHVQLEDVFFASFNHLFLCPGHRGRTWKTTINLLENCGNCPVVPHDVKTMETEYES